MTLGVGVVLTLEEGDGAEPINGGDGVELNLDGRVETLNFGSGAELTLVSCVEMALGGN